MVTHFRDHTGTPRCGAGWYSNNPPTTDRARVTCKSCLRWLEHDDKAALVREADKPPGLESAGDILARMHRTGVLWGCEGIHHG